MVNLYDIDGIEVKCPPEVESIKNLIKAFKSELVNYSDTTAIEKYQNNKIEQMLALWGEADAQEFRKIYSENFNKIYVLSRAKEEQIKLSSQKWATIITLSLFFGVLGLVMYSFYSGKEERDLRHQARNEFYSEVTKAQTAVERILKDPDSAQFRDQIYNCGQVNSKNWFGAYMGYKRYIVADNQVFLEGVNADSISMDKYWKDVCRGAR